MSETWKRIEEFAKNELKRLLDQCTKDQRNLFNRLYGSVEAIPMDKIRWAITQCERAIAYNNAHNGTT